MNPPAGTSLESIQLHFSPQNHVKIIKMSILQQKKVMDLKIKVFLYIFRLNNKNNLLKENLILTKIKNKNLI